MGVITTSSKRNILHGHRPKDLKDGAGPPAFYNLTTFEDISKIAYGRDSEISLASTTASPP